MPKGGHEGHGFPVAVRNFGREPCAARRPSLEWRHVRLGPCLIDEDQALRRDPALMLHPLGAPPCDVRAIPFAGDDGFMEWPAPPSGVMGSPEVQLERWIMKIAVPGIDLGKNVCSLAGLDHAGVVIVRRRARRDTLIDFVSKLPACIAGMEACCGAHHLGRHIRGSRTRRPAVARICAALCEGAEER